MKHYFSKVVDLMDKIVQPSAVTDIQIEWQNLKSTDDIDETFRNEHGPSKIGALFNGRRVTAYAFVDKPL